MKMKTAINGWVLETEDGEIVYQDPDEEDCEIERFANFLRVIDDQFGPPSSRYSPKRIYIRVEPGDKFEDIINSCSITSSSE
jgi:hypothetical protein